MHIMWLEMLFILISTEIYRFLYLNYEMNGGYFMHLVLIKISYIFPNLPWPNLSCIYLQFRKINTRHLVKYLSVLSLYTVIELGKGEKCNITREGRLLRKDICYSYLPLFTSVASFNVFYKITN